MNREVGGEKQGDGGREREALLFRSILCLCSSPFSHPEWPISLLVILMEQHNYGLVAWE